MPDIYSIIDDAIALFATKGEVSSRELNRLAYSAAARLRSAGFDIKKTREERGDNGRWFAWYRCDNLRELRDHPIRKSKLGRPLIHQWRRGRVRDVFVPTHGWVQREDPPAEYERPIAVVTALGQTFPIYSEDDELNFELTPEILANMTLYECARCHAITGVGYTVGDINLCYDCRMKGKGVDYQQIHNEDRRTVTLVRGDRSVVKMGIGIQRTGKEQKEKIVLTPRRAMTLQEPETV